MPIELLCPSCGTKLRVADSQAGQTVACPNCRTSLLVPGSAGVPRAARGRLFLTFLVIVSLGLNCLTCGGILGVGFTGSGEKIPFLNYGKQSAHNLQVIGSAVKGYQEANGAFPAQANYDSAGKPLLSWRVHLLPFLDQDKLYKEFHLQEPWDSEHNRRLVERMPDVYRSNPSLALAGKTTYLGPVNAACFFSGAPKGLGVADISDGPENTIAVVDADDSRAVPWTKPEDLPYDPAQPRSGLAARYGGYLALFADGRVHTLPENTPEDTLKGLFTRAGGESVSVPGN
jgi:DNA-directed RNA polymerase subunit RPC12/RpoP